MWRWIGLPPQPFRDCAFRASGVLFAHRGRNAANFVGFCMMMVSGEAQPPDRTLPYAVSDRQFR
jgi:hypothetical protein